MKYIKLIYYLTRRQKIQRLCIFISPLIILINSQLMAGIPLEKDITPEEAEARYEEMKREKERISRMVLAEKQKREKELEKETSPIKPTEITIPTPKEEKLPPKKEEVKKVEKKIKEAIPEGRIEGRLPGLLPPEKEIEHAKKIQKIPKKVIEERNISFILAIVVMLATIIFLVRSMYKGRAKDEGEKE